MRDLFRARLGGQVRRLNDILHFGLHNCAIISAGFQYARTVWILPSSLTSMTSTPSNFTSFPLALTPWPVHLTAAPLPATKTQSSVRPTLLKFLQIDSRNSRIAARPVIPGVPTGSNVVPSSANVLEKASASIARIARK